MTIGPPKPVILKLPPNATATQITKAYKPKVYRVKVYYKEHRKKQGILGQYVEITEIGRGGSGILIANDLKQGLIVTNRHVIDPGYEESNVYATNVRVQVKNSLNDEFVQAKIVTVSKTNDLALLLVDGKWDTVEAVQVIKNKSIVQGEDAIALGNPLGLEFFTLPGIISGKAKGEIGITCPIEHGNSGGPLLLNRHGYLAGIITSGAGRTASFADPAEAVLTGLKQTKESKDNRGTWARETPGWLWKNKFADKPTVLRLIDMVPLVDGE